MKILFYSKGDNAAQWVECLARHLPDAEVIVWQPGMTEVRADFALAWAPPADFFAGQQFKAVFALGAGVDALLRLPHIADLLGATPLIRLNDAGMAAQMAEYVHHHLTHIARGFQQFSTQQRTATWKKRGPIKPQEWPVGVMGLGDMGAAVARALVAANFPVAAWTRQRRDAALHMPGVTAFAGSADWQSFLRRTRVLVCVLPLTEDTRDIINANALAELMPNAVLINVARGAHVVDNDLITALDSGRLIHAVLDVFREEPLPASHPFWAHPNITVTPHIAALTLVEDSVEQIATKIRAMTRGEAVEGVVDLARGY